MSLPQETLPLLRSLAGLSESIAASRDLETLGVEIERAMERFFPVEFSKVYRVEGSRLRLLRARNFTADERAWAEATAWERIPGRVVRTGEPFYDPESAEPLGGVPDKAGVKSRLYVPARRNGRILGVLGVGSTRPHAFGELHFEVLRFLGGLAAAAFENTARAERLRRSLHRLRETRAQVRAARRREGQVAARIQRTLLYGQPPKTLPGLEVGAAVRAARAVGGDFYDFLLPSRGILDVAVGDAMGKGLPAALLGAATKKHLQGALGELIGQSWPDAPPPEAVVQRAHHAMLDRLEALDAFVTLAYARFDLPRRRLALVDCGHQKPLLLRPGQAPRLLQGDDPPLGIPLLDRHSAVEVDLEPGDLLLFYSDGLQEPSGGRGVCLEPEQLAEEALGLQHLPCRRLARGLLRRVLERSGVREYCDDAMCVAVRVSA